MALAVASIMRIDVRWLATLVATSLLAIACAADEPELDAADDSNDLGDGDGKGDDPIDPEWTSIGRGVVYRQVNTGAGVLVAYGGYSAKLAHSAAWASELVDAKLGALDVGHIYAIRGPADPGYGSREISNTKLREHLAGIDDGNASLYVVAHSSGSYVAHELLGQIRATGNAALLARISYANLDGGGSGLTAAIAESLGNLSFVYARDPALSNGLSQNAGTARALGVAHAPHGKAVEVSVAETGCANGAGWCLHDVVITHRPHDRYTYDLARDYTDFDDRPVTTEYLDF